MRCSNDITPCLSLSRCSNCRWKSFKGSWHHKRLITLHNLIGFIPQFHWICSKMWSQRDYSYYLYFVCPSAPHDTSHTLLPLTCIYVCLYVCVNVRLSLGVKWLKSLKASTTVNWKRNGEETRWPPNLKLFAYCGGCVYMYVVIYLESLSIF